MGLYQRISIIEHQALKALGGRERISMAATFRPRSPMMKDETVPASVRVLLIWSFFTHSTQGTDWNCSRNELESC